MLTDDYHSGATCLLQELPQFKYQTDDEDVIFSQARLVHWLVLQGDVARVREGRGELPQCRDLFCSRTVGENGDTSQVKL